MLQPRLPCRVAAVPFLLLNLLPVARVQAEIFCVASEQQLQAALIAAGANGEDDEIRMRVGTYRSSLSPYPSGFSFSSSEARAVALSGGWTDPECGARSFDARDTIVTGNGVRRGLRASYGHVQGSHLRIDGITFRHGYAGGADGMGGAIQMQSHTPNNYPSVSIERCIFEYNEATVVGGAVAIAGEFAQVTIRDSLFVGNKAEIAGAIDLRPSVAGAVTYMSNNTVMGNIATNPSLPWNASGVVLRGSGSFALSNNLIHFNSAAEAIPELWASGVSHVLVGNAIGSATGNPGAGSHGSHFQPPLFVGPAGDYRLHVTSPLRNGGTNAIHGGLAEFDAYGRARVLEEAVDVGALESDVLMINDFE